jgi:hypothetical protein
VAVLSKQPLFDIHLHPRQSRFSFPAGIRSAVSLHGHSECSRETLEFIPRIARRIPMVAQLYERGLAQYQKENGRPLDLGEWYWRPHITPAGVIDSELAHVHEKLGLPGLVSLTDHDTVEGPAALRAAGLDVPLSVEWSVPFDQCLFHLGVHAISPSSIDEMMAAFALYTQGSPDGSPRRLAELLDALHECPGTLVVLNHPCWDLAGVGQMRHDSTLLAFLRAFQHRIHALELNGYRHWIENRCVLPLARGFNIPVVGGGDRHGLAPNTIVNVTRAAAFEEFAHELRVERVSRCVIFPEYAHPFVGRVLKGACEVLRPHPRHHRRQTTWPERVFITIDGVEHSVASLWEGEPLWLRSIVAATRIIGSRAFDALFQLTRADGHDTLEADCRFDSQLDGTREFVRDSAAA